MDLDVESIEEGEREETDLDQQPSTQGEGEGSDQSSNQPINQGGDFGNDEPEIRTADALEEALKDLTDTRDNREKIYVELPKLNLKNIIIPNENIYEGQVIHLYPSFI